MIRPHHQIWLFGLLVAAACGGAAPRGELPPPAPTLAPSDTACLIAAGRPTSRDTVTIALTDPVDPAHAPLPRNVAERFVFAQLYETLIRVDCRGRVLPALARSWEQGPEGRWTGARLESRSGGHRPGRSSAQHRSDRPVVSALRRSRARGDQVRSGWRLAHRHRPLLDDRLGGRSRGAPGEPRSEEHTSELQSPYD